ncbi:uncharacterized protein [Parasteatoda tepidariorum]|uniref:uncharacterized protein n=1 Tax=Parasteatoda tepidariorum TaxID=114398 RepID=UPI001C7181DF|nr:uncharacterized protein LOC122268911 [Parasteatoda tepidariorum]
MDGYLKRKHVETENEPKRKGLFQEGNFPEYCYPIGEDLFVLASTYNKKSVIHIRRFNRYGDSHNPSGYGITLQPEQYNACFCHGPPTCIFGIADINMALEEIPPANPREKFYVLMNDEGKNLLVDELVHSIPQPWFILYLQKWPRLQARDGNQFQTMERTTEVSR